MNTIRSIALAIDADPDRFVCYAIALLFFVDAIINLCEM